MEMLSQHIPNSAATVNLARTRPPQRVGVGVASKGPGAEGSAWAISLGGFGPRTGQAAAMPPPCRRPSRSKEQNQEGLDPDPHSNPEPGGGEGLR